MERRLLNKYLNQLGAVTVAILKTLKVIFGKWFGMKNISFQSSNYEKYD